MVEKGPLENRTVLIVDDYMVNVELLKIFVKETGGIALSASNGIECLDVIKKQKVDLILMDLNMPEMNGLEATKAIREMPEFKNMIIIGVIGYEDKEEIELCRNTGMNDAIPKFTFSPEKLMEIGNTYFTSNSNTGEIKSMIKPDEANCKNVTPDNLIMDFDKALREFESDRELLINLLKEFDSIVKEQLESINDFLKNNEIKRVEIEAHTIKGGAANICAQLLFVSAKELESACKKSLDKEVIFEKLNELSKQARVFSEFVFQRVNHQ